MTSIGNPVLPGFNPDPSIVRVGDKYYIATSTFEWFPGVQIHHSRDLVHWRLIGPVLDASKLSDDYRVGLHFTGAFVGLCAQDIGGTGMHADFDCFTLHHDGGHPR